MNGHQVLDAALNGHALVLTNKEKLQLKGILLQLNKEDTTFDSFSEKLERELLEGSHPKRKGIRSITISEYLNSFGISGDSDHYRGLEAEFGQAFLKETVPGILQQMAQKRIRHHGHAGLERVLDIVLFDYLVYEVRAQRALQYPHEEHERVK